MSENPPARPAPLTPTRPHTFAIVASEYNPELVANLIAAVKEELGRLAPHASVALYRVPGAFEIPVIVQEVASRKGIDAVIALGVIIAGATAHADLVGRSVTDALQGIAVRERLPVIHEVLLVENEEQAQQRTTGEEKNRGLEAARAAVRVVAVLDSLRN